MFEGDSADISTRQPKKLIVVMQSYFAPFRLNMEKKLVCNNNKNCSRRQGSSLLCRHMLDIPPRPSINRTGHFCQTFLQSNLKTFPSTLKKSYPMFLDPTTAQFSLCHHKMCFHKHFGKERKKQGSWTAERTNRVVVSILELLIAVKNRVNQSQSSILIMQYPRTNSFWTLIQLEKLL